jgi:putative ABC transport system permease protein
VFKIALRGVRHNIGRYIATLVAISTGVAFFAASGFLSDRVIDALEGDVNRQYETVDAAVVVDTDGAGDFAGETRIGGDIAASIAALPEVAAVAGEFGGPVAFLADDNTTFGDGATGRPWIVDDELNPAELVEGAAPAVAGEITVDRGLAGDEDLAVGDRVVVLSAGGQFDATIVGITRFGEADSIDQNGTVRIPAPTVFDWLNGGTEEYEELLIRGTVGQDELVAAIDAVTPDGFEVQSGTTFLADKRDEASAFGKFLKIGLQAFALLALFVGGFVIYNTFSVIVAQRLRELAVLAAIGATPKQIKRSLRFEGLVIGVIGSLLGVLLGFAMTFVLVAVLGALGIHLPGSGIKITPTSIVSGVLVGTVITLASMMIPARRASRTEPMEALRQAAVEGASVSRTRIITATTLMVLGALLLVTGGGPALGLGALMLFIGVIVAGPMLAVLASRLFSPIGKRMGLEGRLAADNTRRNPQRTATTSNALLIGVYLVTLVTVAGTSMKDFAVGEINKLSGADYFLTSTGGSIDDDIVTQLTAVDGVATVAPFRRESVTVDGEPSSISTGEFDTLVEAAGIEVKEGTFDDLGPGRIVLVEDLVIGGGSSSDGPSLGDQVSVANSNGTTADLEIVGLVEGSLDTGFTGSFVDAQTFSSLAGDVPPSAAFIDLVDGAETDTKDALDEVLARRPDISLIEGSSIGELVGSVFDFLINAVNGLLLMSVAIALIGIVNTMSLSILERRRELGLLRVMGMLDRRVQRMVRIESVIISALGTITGIALGTFTGWALVRAINRLSDAAVSTSVPWILLLVVLVLGVALGFVAALIPARRSTRLEVLEAIQAT